jgi:hypothetical protein
MYLFAFIGFGDWFQILSTCSYACLVIVICINKNPIRNKETHGNCLILTTEHYNSQPICTGGLFPRDMLTGLKKKRNNFSD